ncbi:MAG TPA: hypothetical protein VI341_02920 [Actinomycetota bacterium]
MSLDIQGAAPRKLTLLAVLVVLIGAMVGTLFVVTRDTTATAGQPPRAEDFVGGTMPLGPDLAAHLGLESQSTFDGECAFFQEVEESGAGYCLEELGLDEVDAYVVALALRGVTPSRDQLQTIEEVIARGTAADSAG